TGQAMLAVVADPAAHGTQLKAMLVGKAHERNFLFQKRAHQLKARQGTAALGFGKAAGWRFIGHVSRSPSSDEAGGDRVTNSVAEKVPNSVAEKVPNSAAGYSSSSRWRRPTRVSSIS